MATESRPAEPAGVQAYGQWILVRMEALPEKAGSIWLPQGSFERWEGRAVVESVGRGIPTKQGWKPHDVKPGDVVIIARAHARTSTGERMQEALGEGRIFIRWNDIMCVVEDESTGKKQEGCAGSST